MTSLDTVHATYKSLTEQQLLEELKRSPDFDKYVLPNSWYAKYDLPKKECMDMKQFLKESPWMKRSHYTYSPKVITLEAKPGGNRPILPTPEIPIQVVQQNMFSDATDQTEPSGPAEIRLVSVSSTDTTETTLQQS